METFSIDTDDPIDFEVDIATGCGHDLGAPIVAIARWALLLHFKSIARSVEIRFAWRLEVSARASKVRLRGLIN